MNYCPRCGAYIPQGYTECLACGYSAKEAKNPDVHGGFASHAGGASATAQATAPEASEYHHNYKKKEEAKQKTEQYEYGQAKKEETAKQQQKEQKQYSRIDERIDIENYKSVSYLSYLGPLFLVPMFLCKDSPFAQFHARQGLKLFVLEIIVNACWSMGLLGVLVALLGTVLAAWCVLNGLVNVSQGVKRVLPVIGNLGKNGTAGGGSL